MWPSSPRCMRVERRMDIARWLADLQLGEYERAFAEHAVDEAALAELDDDDLRALGVARLGHRKKLLTAIRLLRTNQLVGEPPARSSGVHEDLGVDVAALPSILAIPLAEYAAERDSRLALWHACDVVELTLRLVVFIGLGDLARAGDLPRDLLGELQP